MGGSGRACGRGTMSRFRFVAAVVGWAVLTCAPSALAQASGRVVAVKIETSNGTIKADIYSERAPISAANFLRYADDGVFDGGSFFRAVRIDNQPNDSVRIEVIQGSPDRATVRDRLRPAIPLERTIVTGLRHIDGALSMARAGIDSGQTHFFVTIGEQPSLDFGGNRNLDGQGFAVFGRVTSGMDVVRRIHAGSTDGQTLVEPVRIESVRRVEGELPPESVARIQAHVDSLVEYSDMPGLTLGLSLPQGPPLGFAAGVSDTARSVELTPADLMLQGSVGKTYFGAVALQLVAEQRLGLDDRLGEYLGDEPWYDQLPNGADVTIRQLMSHTSGIVRYEFNPAFLQDLTADPMRTFTPEERLAYLFGMEPPFAAGEGWDYSDTNFILVAMVIEQVTGGSAYGEIRRRLLEPLGLDETVPSDRPSVPGLVNGYTGPDNQFGTFDATVHDGALAFNPQFEWGGGGFASTSRDLAEWVRHVQEGRAFDSALLAEFRTGVPAPLGPQGQYGLGVIMMELPSGTAWGHSGFMPGYRTEAYYFPEHGFALALQINTTDRGASSVSPLRLLDGIAALVADELTHR
jgi:D-alanyl-D-alanine carboxypeptidase